MLIQPAVFAPLALFAAISTAAFRVIFFFTNQMKIHQRQEAFISKYMILPNAHERLAALTARRGPLSELPPEERVDSALVPGCVSRVWLAGKMENGRCRFQIHAESALVKGLAAALCELYDDAPPQEILDEEPHLFESLGIAAHLSPTRLNGLAHLRGRIAEFAASQLT